MLSRIWRKRLTCFASHPPNIIFCWTRHLLRWTGVDVKSGSVYCSECNNFIYHSKLDALYLATTVAAEEKQMGVWLPTLPPRRSDTSSATHKESFKPWSPSPKEIQALEGAESIACQGELFDDGFSTFLSSSTGRRGLLNLGQTCFLNVVLQCLAHNPLLRNYFLSDKHNCRQCKIEHCTSCEMDKLFTEVKYLFFPLLVEQNANVAINFPFFLDIFGQHASLRSSDILSHYLESICRTLRLCTTRRTRVFYLYSEPDPCNLTCIHKRFV